MTHKTSSHEATRALLMEGVASARVESHRLRHLLERALVLVEESDEKDSLYEVAGDIIKAVPERLDALDRVLDRTNYALAVVGEDEMRNRLPLSDRILVDDAVHHGLGNDASLRQAATRLARRYIADKHPALGYPGGPCYVIERIHNEVRNPRLQAELIEDIELGQSLSNAQASKVYDLEVERGAGRFKKIEITSHAQYRMDQRGVVVPEIRMAVQGFLKQWGDYKSQRHPQAQRWEQDMAYREPISWTDPKLKLTVVFLVVAKDTIRIITTYWEGVPDPKPKGEAQCALPGRN